MAGPLSYSRTRGGSIPAAIASSVDDVGQLRLLGIGRPRRPGAQGQRDALAADPAQAPGDEEVGDDEEDDARHDPDDEDPGDRLDGSRVAVDQAIEQGPDRAPDVGRRDQEVDQVGHDDREGEQDRREVDAERDAHCRGGQPGRDRPQARATSIAPLCPVELFAVGGGPHASSIGCAVVRYDRAMTERPLKVLIAKPGLDGHDRGAKVLARGLRDEGFEVVYTGLRQTPEMIATAALQEDVDVVGLSILSGAHMTLVPRVTKLLTERGMDDVLVTVGGIIPDDDVAALRAAGVAEIFGPGTTIAQVADYLRANARPRD